MQIGKEPAGVGFDLRQVETFTRVRAVHNQPSGEGAWEWNKLASISHSHLRNDMTVDRKEM